LNILIYLVLGNKTEGAFIVLKLHNLEDEGFLYGEKLAICHRFFKWR